ncbi:DNA-directed RNA polymerase III subunit RPC6 [Pancytospora philotis]|nr:DNA-directed RNA polymerase III subunit RPC6 [Pancytospora philotis]
MPKGLKYRIPKQGCLKHPINSQARASPQLMRRHACDLQIFHRQPMGDVLEYLLEREDGATEEELCGAFAKLTKLELATVLNGLLKSNQIEIVKTSEKIYYKAVRSRTTDYEGMIIALLGQIGSNGMWLRDIKLKTNIPHNLILKILRNLETARKIKSVKSVKNNRKMYLLYDLKPDEEVTGGVWFNNNDVDLVFVNKLMDIMYQYCAKPEDEYALPKMDSLVRLVDLKTFIDSSGISEVELSMGDLNTLVDCLVYDGRMERHTLEDKVVLRSLKPGYLSY